LGEVVTDKLIEAFPEIMELGYTRDMEDQLDKIEEENRDWRDVLDGFYTPFKLKLAEAEENLTHAKAELQPAPYECPECGSATVYRFGKNGRFLSCSTYPDCTYSSPINRAGEPQPAEFVNVRCPQTGRPMIRKTGRFGPFITTLLEKDEPQENGMILNIDKKGKIKAPAPPPVLTDLECEKCGKQLNLRDGARGPWLGCSGFPKCRGRGKWSELTEEKQKELELELRNLLEKNPIPIIKTLDGRPLTNEKGQPLAEAPKVDDLLIEDPSEYDTETSAA
ncbi:MAG: topoisomerase DNA-binding C4 zinc finger domain-containing protein, partial [Planctomycetota bacterium]